MKLEVFNVEHGACSLITTDSGMYIMIDCGHNSTMDWKPGDHLVSRQITELEALIISNYDEDHVSGLQNLRDQVNVRWIYRNKSVSPRDIRALKSEYGTGPGIDRLIYELENNFTGKGGNHDMGNLEVVTFRNNYPTDFEDENNLSLVTFMKCHGRSILFPGDLEIDGWRKLLQQQRFREELSGVSIFLASHHGRESGICEEVFDYCEPFYILISDKHKGYQTQETTDFYRSVSRGGPFRGENRHILTTRRDGKITFNFGPDGWGPEW